MLVGVGIKLDGGTGDGRRVEGDYWKMKKSGSRSRISRNEESIKRRMLEFHGKKSFIRDDSVLPKDRIGH